MGFNPVKKSKKFVKKAVHEIASPIHKATGINQSVVETGLSVGTGVLTGGLTGGLVGAKISSDLANDLEKDLRESIKSKYQQSDTSLSEFQKNAAALENSAKALRNQSKTDYTGMRGLLGDYQYEEEDIFGNLRKRKFF